MPFTTDAEWLALQAKIQGWIDAWADRMWLNWWDVHIVWYRGDIPDSNREAVPPGRKALMDCTPDYRYFEATIRVNLERALDFGDDYLENVVIHELAHIVLNEMRDWKPSRKGMKREERVATHLQKIVRELVREKEAALAKASTPTVKGVNDGQAEQGDRGGPTTAGEQGVAAQAAEEVTA